MKSILNTITAMLAAVLFVPAASAQTTSNPRMQVRVSLEKLSLYMRQSPNVLTQDDPRPLPKPKKWDNYNIIADNGISADFHVFAYYSVRMHNRRPDFEIPSRWKPLPPQIRLY